VTVVGAMFLGLAETYPRIFSSNAAPGNAVTFALVLFTLAILFRPERASCSASRPGGTTCQCRYRQPRPARDRGDGGRARDRDPLFFSSYYQSLARTR